VPLSSYSDLQSSILDWLVRPDLTTLAPDFIRLLEARINQELTLEATLVTVTGTLTASVLTLPSDWNATKAVWLGTAPQAPLLYRPPQQLLTLQETNTWGDTRYFTVLGSSMRFAPIPAATSAYGLIYYALIPALSGSLATNWLLTNAPGVYLYGSLVEGALYTQDDSAAMKWEALYQRAVSALKKSDVQAAYSGGVLAVRNL
jgi:hypothetical protein